MADNDEFAEFETDEATFDAMLERAEPAELVPPPAFITVLSAARDTVTFQRGLPVSVGDSSSTRTGLPIRQSPARRPPAIRQEQPTEKVAG